MCNNSYTILNEIRLIKSRADLRSMAMFRNRATFSISDSGNLSDSSSKFLDIISRSTGVMLCLIICAKLEKFNVSKGVSFNTLIISCPCLVSKTISFGLISNLFNRLARYSSILSFYKDITN